MDWNRMINESFKDGRSVAELLEEAYQMGRAEADNVICEYEIRLRRNFEQMIVTHSVNEILDKSFDDVHLQ